MHRTILTLALTSFATITAAQDGPLQVNIELAASLEGWTCSQFMVPENKKSFYYLIYGAAMAASRNEDELAYSIEIFSNNVALCAIRTPEGSLIEVLRETVIR